jgi:hypothetical protein
MAGHYSFLRVKVTFADLVTLMLIRHFLANLLVGIDGPVFCARQLLDHHGGQEKYK